MTCGRSVVFSGYSQVSSLSGIIYTIPCYNVCQWLVVSRLLSFSKYYPVSSSNRILHATPCDNACQWLAVSRLFSTDGLRFPALIWYSILHHVIMFVSGLRQVVCFLRILGVLQQQDSLYSSGLRQIGWFIRIAQTFLNTKAYCYDVLLTWILRKVKLCL